MPNLGENVAVGDTKPLENSLKLAFSAAHDFHRINEMLAPDIGDSSHPNRFLADRLSTAFARAVAGGSAAFMEDATGELKAVTVAYHLNAAEDPDLHTHTELGSTSSAMPGYSIANLVVAALALREWLHNPPAEMIAAKIRPENIPSLKVYKEALGWAPIEDRALHAQLTDASRQTMADPSNPLNGREWYALKDVVIKKQAETVLGFMEQGGLVNKQTGDFIPVDFSALEKEGLTRARLEALAAGVTTRNKLPKPTP